MLLAQAPAGPARLSLGNALATVERTPDFTRQAWALRNTFDYILSMEEEPKLNGGSEAKPRDGADLTTSGSDAEPAEVPSSPKDSSEDSKAPQPLGSLEEGKTAIRLAITCGAPMYNAGDIEGCARLYGATADALTQLDDQVRRVIFVPLLLMPAPAVVAGVQGPALAGPAEHDIVQHPGVGSSEGLRRDIGRG
jgi:hypothetical protein